MSAKTFTVTVADTTPPVITPPVNVTMEATDANGALVTYAPAMAIDAVTTNPMISYSKDSGTLFPIGMTTVTITATDDAGNMSAKTFTVTVSDTTPPVITPPVNVTMEATDANGALVTYAPAMAIDAVTTNPMISYSKDSGTLFPIGMTPVTITATDDAGNMSAKTFTVTVSDTTPPVITPPVNVTMEATDANGALVTYAPAMAMDAVTTNPMISYSKDSGTLFSIGMTPVTITATDDAGNMSAKTFTVTVSDTTPPVITPPVNVTMEATDANGALVTYAPAMAIDAVTTNPMISYSKDSGTLFPIGMTLVTITATDDAGNMSAKTFTVTVSDTTPPVITPPVNVTMEATDANGALVTYAPAMAMDAVTTNPMISYSKDSGTLFSIGMTPVTITATDDAGNMSAKTFTVTVSDTTPPVITPPVNVTMEATDANGALVTYAPAMAIDAVTTNPMISYSKDSGTLFPIGMTLVTITATDDAGNMSAKTFTVTVSDTTPPVIASHAIVSIQATSASGAIVTYDPATATDAVTVSPNISYSQDSGTQFPLGVTTVIITATDASNNLATSPFKVIVYDLNNIYVDPGYGTTTGTSVNFPNDGGSGPHTVGYDAFNSLAAAYNALLPDGMLHLAPGAMFTGESLTLTKDFTVFVPTTTTPTILNDTFSNSGFRLIKAGAGKLILAQADTVKSVDVQGGTLLVNGTTLTVTSGITVESGATLGGSGGTYVGNVTVLAGGIFSPGASIGVTNVTGDLTLNGASALTIEMIGYTDAGDPTTGYDQLNVSGTLTIAPTASLVLSLTGGLMTPGLTDAGVVTYGVGRTGVFSDVSILTNTGHLAYTLGYDSPYGQAIAVQLDSATDVFVDGSLPASEDIDGDQFFKSISPAKDFVTSGGKVHVKGNTYTEDITLDKDFTFFVDVPTDLVQINGNLNGGNALTKDGPGTLELDGNANTNAAQVNVSGGVLYVDGVLTMTANKIVQLNGGKLGGSGTINGAISMTGSGGTIQPGAGIGSYGTLTATNTVSLAGTGALKIKVKNQGVVAGTDYDLFNILGGNTLTLNTSSLLVIDIKNLYKSTSTINVVSTTVANGIPTAFQAGNISLINPPAFAPTPVLTVSYPTSKQFVAIQVTLPPPNSVVVDGTISQTNGTTLTGTYNGRVVGYDAFNTIQAGVNAVAANGTVSVATGSYNETVTLGTSNQPIKLVGSGSSTANKFIINTTQKLVAGSGGITAPMIDLFQGAAISDGLLLASDVTPGPRITLFSGGLSYGAGVLTQDVQLRVAISGTSATVGSLTGTSILTKIGSGTLIATNTSSYSGPTNVNVGTLEVDGTLTSNVTVNSGGTLTGTGMTGAITVNSGGQITPGTIAATGTGLLTGGSTDLSNGTLNIKVAGIVAGTSFGQLNLGANTLTLGSTSKLILDVGSLSTVPATITIITYGGTIPAPFNTVQVLNDDTNKYSYSLNYTATGVQLSLAAHTDTFVDGSWTGLPDGTTVFFGTDLFNPHVIGADAYATVQNGVTNVVATKTVHVAPGTYIENVTIGKALTLVGALAGTPGYTNAAIGPVPQLPSSGIRANIGETVLTSPGGTAIVTVNASPVTFDGVRVLSPVSGGGLNQGISGSTLATNLTIQNSVFDFSASTDANTFGINLVSSAALTYTCQQNAFTGKAMFNGTASNTSQTGGTGNISGSVMANLFVRCSVGISGAFGVGAVANNVLIGGGISAVGIHGAFSNGTAVTGNTFSNYSSASGAAVIVSAVPVGQLGAMTFTGNTVQSSIEELQLDDTSAGFTVNGFTIQTRTPGDLDSIVNSPNNTFDRAVYITDSAPSVLNEGAGVIHVRGTIQSAVDNALATNTVHVLNGTYIENVTIPEALTILGNGVANTIVKPAVAGDVFTLTHDSISINKLTIDGSNVVAFGANGVATDNTPTLTNIAVNGVTIQNVSDSGVKNASTEGSTTVDHCSISTLNGTAGVSVSNGSATVTNNTISSAKYGVFVASSPAAATVNIGTVGNANTISMCTVGVISQSAGSTVGDSIAHNTLTNNTYGAIIELPLNAASKVNANTVTSNFYGVAVFGGSATISNNTISPSGTGILASSIVPVGGDVITVVTVTGNILTGLGTGIAVAKGTPLTEVDASTNTISTSASGVGVQFITGFNDYLNNAQTSSGGIANLTNNSLTGLAKGAIANNAGSLKLLQNTIQTNSIGVDVNGGTVDTIQNNFINQNNVGIQYESLASNAGTIFNNDLSGNTTLALNDLIGTIAIIDASGNWWGGNSPASVTGTISGTVDYSPWLDKNTNTVLALVPGFAGDFGWIHVDNRSAKAGIVAYIQEGVNSATVVGKVQVEDGNGLYAEDVLVAKDLTLYSTHGNGFVTIAGQSTAANIGAVKVTAGAKVAIGTLATDGFTIKGAGRAAVYLGASAGVSSLTGNILSAADTMTAVTAHSSGHTFNSNTFTVATGGSALELVHISPSAIAMTVTNNTFTGKNTIGLLQQAEGSMVTGNNFSASASTDARLKLNIGDAGTISGNDFTGAVPTTGFGAQIWDLQRAATPAGGLLALYNANTFDRGALAGFGANQLLSSNGQAIFDRIAQAIVGAFDGATPIDIRNGVYNETDIAVNKSVSLNGQTLPRNVMIVPSSGTGSALVISSGAVTVQNLTIDGSAGGAGNAYDKGISASGAVALNSVAIDTITLKNIGATAIDFAPALNSSNLTIDNNSISGVPIGAHITSTQSRVTNNNISNVTTAGIDFDGGSVADSSTFYSNTVTSAGHGLKLAHLGDTSVVGALTLENSVTLTSALDNQYAILISASLGAVSVAENTVDLGSSGVGNDIGIGVLNSDGVVTVDSNHITSQKGNSGIFLLGNSTGDAVVTHNSITATNATVGAAQGRATGIVVSDILAGSLPGGGVAGDATIQNNTISGFDRGIDVLQLGTTGGGLTAQIGGLSGQGNTISNVKTSGVRVFDANKLGTTAPSANAQVTFNTGISGTGIGIDIDGGSAFVGQNTITGNSTAGVRITNHGVATGAGNVAPGLFQNIINNANGVGVIAVDGGTLNGAEQNYIAGNTGDGVKVDTSISDGKVTARIYNNDLSENGGLAIDNITAVLVNASANWFGNNSQRLVTAALSSNVDYTPWFDNGTDTNNVMTGFQGDFTYLNVWNGSPQAAGNYIDEATGLLAGTGLTIQVWANPTAYNETVTLNKRVLLKGAIYAGDPLGRGVAVESTIDGTSKASPLVSVTTGGAGSTIDGFTIKNATSVSVQISDSNTGNRTTLSNNIIAGKTLADAIVVSSSYVTVKANLLNATTGGSSSGVSVDANVTDTTIDSNEIQHASMAAVNLLGFNDSTLIKNNKLMNNVGGAGINLQGGVPVSVLIFDNSIQSFAQIGLSAANASIGNTINAMNNFWGDSSGPFDSTNNPAGLGSSVSNLGTNYSVWLGDGTDKTPSVIGFQPNTVPVFGLATQLVFTTEPGNGFTSQHINPQPVIKAYDINGNFALSYNGQVTVLLFNNPLFASLIGATTIFATNGVAAFSDLGVSKHGSYQLRAVAPGIIAPVLSTPFMITDPATPTITSINPSVVQQNSASFLLDVQDTNGSLTSTTTVLIDGTPIVTSFVNANEVYGIIPASILTSVGSKVVTVKTNIYSSNSLILTVKGAATASLSNLNAVYDGSSKSVSVTTTPSGLAVDVTYTDSRMLHP